MNIIVGFEGQDGQILASKLRALSVPYIGIGRSRAIIFDGVTIQDCDASNPEIFFQKQNIDVVYYLAAHHHSSEKKFGSVIEDYEQSFLTNHLSVLRYVGWIQKYSPATKLIFASSSRVYEGLAGGFVDESSLKVPLTPYAISKLATQTALADIAKQDNLCLISCMLFNHESIYRGSDYLSTKITQGVIDIHLGKAQKLEIGSLKPCVDWSHAEDIVDAMYLCSKQATSQQYIVASGILHSVEDFVREAFLYFQMDYKDYVVETNSAQISYRPGIAGNPSLIMKNTGWKPRYTFDEMIRNIISVRLQGEI
jgi:GDPmannose 4,6-dehydratase